MKSLLVSALAMGIAFGSTKYYIGNYTVKSTGTVTVVPYPLDKCVPNGAITGFNYIMLFCNGDGNMTQYTFAMNDPTCEGAYESTEFPSSPLPGMLGYASCEGNNSYIELEQYLSSCSSWKEGKSGLAKTIIARNVCVFYTVDLDSGAPIYTRTTCTSDGTSTHVYAVDASCSSTNPYLHLSDQDTSSPGDCHFYKSQSGLDIYTAMSRCVIDDVPQRCLDPLASYEAEIMIEDSAYSPNYYHDLYWDMFSYATVDVSAEEMDDVTTVDLWVGFCNEWENGKYVDVIKNLGQQTLDQINYNNATVCWQCVDCVNSTECSDAEYCTSEKRCSGETTSSTTKVENSTPRFVSAFILSLVMFFSFIVM